MTITITHDHADGTLVTGDPRPHQQALKDAGFRWSRNVGWYLRNSRDRDANLPAIDRAADGLRAAGFDVVVTVDNTARDVAEREADAAVRSAARVEGLGRKADRLAEQSEAHLGKADAITGMIPLGQPILVGHHSERRHRRDLDRAERNLRKGYGLADEARETERRAGAAAARQEHRESGPATIRRIDRLETELRDIDRKLAPCTRSGQAMKPEAAGRTVTCPSCYHDVTIGDDLTFPVHGGTTGNLAWEATLLTRKASIEADLVYWRQHLDQLRADGFHQWSRDDFAVGDFVNGTDRVVRVNAKTLTVQTPHFPEGMTHKLAYNKVRTHVRPEQDT